MYEPLTNYPKIFASTGQIPIFWTNMTYKGSLKICIQVERNIEWCEAPPFQFNEQYLFDFDAMQREEHK